MNTKKENMSGAYKGVIAINIFVLFLNTIISGVTHSKFGVGTVFAGYSIWLMFRRENEKLFALYKFVLWIIGIAFVLGSMLYLFNQGMQHLDMSYGEFIFDILIAGSFNYFMYKFFKGQLNLVKIVVQKVSNASSTLEANKRNISDDYDWEQVSQEFNSPQRKEGLWARCFAESNGDENKAKARYLNIRFNEYAHQRQGLPNTVTSITSSPVMGTNPISALKPVDENKLITLGDGDSKQPQLLNSVQKNVAIQPKPSVNADIFSMETIPKLNSEDYSSYAISSLMRMGMFERRLYKGKTLFYLHNANVAIVSGNLIKVFDTDYFLKKAIGNSTLSTKYPSGLIVSFDKDSLK